MNNYLRRNKFKENIFPLKKKTSTINLKEKKEIILPYKNENNTKKYFKDMKYKYNQTMRDALQNYNFIGKKEIYLERKNACRGLRRNQSLIKQASTNRINIQENDNKLCNIKENDISIKDLKGDYRIIKNLGKGSFSTTYLVENINNNELYALKELKNNNEDSIKEIEILKKFDNVNIIKYYENFEIENKIYFVLEYAGDRSLNDYINTKTNHRLDEIEARFIFKQIINSITYLHNNGYVHCDLKLDNIIFNKETKKIKLIDFGFCEKIRKKNEFIGTLPYMSYDILSSKNHYNYYDDIWALGVIFFKLIYSIFPFKGKNRLDILNKIKTKKILFPLSINISKDIKRLIMSLLEIDYKKRLTSDKLYNLLN